MLWTSGDWGDRDREVATPLEGEVRCLIRGRSDMLEEDSEAPLFDEEARRTLGSRSKNHVRLNMIDASVECGW